MQTPQTLHILQTMQTSQTSYHIAEKMQGLCDKVSWSGNPLAIPPLPFPYALRVLCGVDFGVF